MNRKYDYLAVAYGGGLNSKALLVEWHNRGLQVPDLILFADTGGEKPETYRDIEGFQAWLSSVGYPEIITVKNSGKHVTLEQECLTQETATSLAFGWKKCSEKYKTRPQNVFTNKVERAKAVWKAGGKVTKLIGIDAGESHRKKIIEDDKYLYLYPLVGWNYDRDDCEKIIKAAGLTVPSKSACFFCPSSTKREILQLAESHPDLYERSIAIERNAAPTLTTVKGLGRRFNWEDYVEGVRGNRTALTVIDDKDIDTPPCETSCVCFDN